MGKTLQEYVKERPVNRAAVDAIKKKMLAEIRTYRLKELREALSLTQVELAARLAVSQNRVSRIEHGDIDRTQVDTLRRYAEALGGTLHIEILYAGERIEIA